MSDDGDNDTQTISKAAAASAAADRGRPFDVRCSRAYQLFDDVIAVAIASKAISILIPQSVRLKGYNGADYCRIHV